MSSPDFQKQAFASNRQSFVHFNVPELDAALAGMKNLNADENQSLKPATPMHAPAAKSDLSNPISAYVYVMHFNLTLVSFHL